MPHSKIVNKTDRKLPLDNSPLYSNRWLAVFYEDDSSFQIRFTTPDTTVGKSYFHVSTTYEICQSRLEKDLFDGYKSIMESISNLFIASVSIVKLAIYDRLDKNIKIYLER
jgi:hypothetical protein